MVFVDFERVFVISQLSLFCIEAVFRTCTVKRRGGTHYKIRDLLFYYLSSK